MSHARKSTAPPPPVDTEQAAIAYQHSAVVAVFEVEQAGLRLARGREREATLQEALATDIEALARARLRYERGQTDFSAVLDVVRGRSHVTQQWVEARTQTFSQLEATNKALGGGWDAQARSSVTSGRTH